MEKKKYLFFVVAVLFVFIVYLAMNTYKKFQYDEVEYCETATEICTCFGSTDFLVLEMWPPSYRYNCKGLEICLPIAKEKRACDTYDNLRP